MLQQIREVSTGWISKVIIGAIVVVFALFGLEHLGSLFGGSSNDNDAATVNGQGISRQQVDQQLMRLARSGQLPPDQQQQARGEVLDQMIQQELMNQYAHKGDMTISDGQVDQLILNLPQFQNKQGQFSQDAFVQKLYQIGYTPETFRDFVKRDLLGRQLQEGFSLGSFATPRERDSLASLSEQERSFRYATLTPAALPQPVSVSDAELHQYYDQHKQDYVRPAQVKLSYLLLDKSTLADAIQVSNDELEKAYADKQKNASRRVSDIVITINNGDRQAAQQKAASIQKELAGGASFANVAKQQSDDKASAAKGGDLGTVTQGIFGQDFDDAVAGLKVGQVSRPVEADGALHLIKLTSLDLPSFDALKGQLTKQVQQHKVNDSFNQVADELSDKSFSADDLVSVAKDTHLPLQHTDWLSEDNRQGVLGNENVMKAAFSDDVLNNGYNSDVLNLSDDRRVVVHVDQHREQQTLSFDQVEDQVRQTVTAQKTHAALEQLAEQRVAALRQGKAAPGLEWHQASNVQRDAKAPAQGIIDGAFAVARPADGKHSYGTADLKDQGVAVVDVSKVSAQHDDATAGKVVNSIRQSQSDSVAKGLVDRLHGEAKIKRNDDD